MEQEVEFASAGVSLSATISCPPGTGVVPGLVLAMLGHSEGGWVALRCCVRGVDVHRLILNSCPGVSFLAAERFARVAAGAGVESAARLYRDLVTAARADVPLERGTRVLASFRAEPWYEAALGGFELTGETWEQLRVWADYDPDDDLRRLRTPTLVVLGGADPLVPVRASVARYERSAEEAGRPQRVVVLAGADHRLEVAETGFADGYLPSSPSGAAPRASGSAGRARPEPADRRQDASGGRRRGQLREPRGHGADGEDPDRVPDGDHDVRRLGRHPRDHRGRRGEGGADGERAPQAGTDPEVIVTIAQRHSGRLTSVRTSHADPVGDRPETPRQQTRAVAWWRHGPEGSAQR